MKRLTLLQHSPADGCDECLLRHGTSQHSVCMGLNAAPLHRRRTPDGWRLQAHADCPLKGDGIVILSAGPVTVLPVKAQR